jgi:hypothetical protein
VANGTSPPLPGWVGQIVGVTTQLGVPTVLAGVLLWFVLFRMGGTLDVIMKEEDNRTRIAASMADAYLKAMEQQNQSLDRSVQRNIDTNKVEMERVIKALQGLEAKR